MKKTITRREFLVAGKIGATGMLLVHRSAASSQRNKNMLLYVGTYTERGSEGIYIFNFNTFTGELTHLHTVKDVVQPSFLAIDKSRKYLYAVNETVEYEGKKSGSVSAFVIDQRNGNLQFLNKQPSAGGAPCHICVSDNEKYVLVANYLGGNVAVLPIEKSGKLGAPVELAQHTGFGPRKDRQEAPHAHSITLAARDSLAFAADLGADKVMIYRFDDKSGKLSTNPVQPYFKTKAGAGPRHFALHPKGKLAFVINELDTTITSFTFDTQSGTLQELQTVPTLNGNKTESDTCADIHISPDGNFLYGSNRGHDSLVVYRIDQKTSRLNYVEHASTGGRTPRNFIISPNGQFLLAANQNSDSIIVFNLDQKTGKLRQTKNRAAVSMPVCLKLIPAFVA